MRRTVTLIDVGVMDCKERNIVTIGCLSTGYEFRPNHTRGYGAPM